MDNPTHFVKDSLYKCYNLLEFLRYYPKNDIVRNINRTQPCGHAARALPFYVPLRAAFMI